VTSQVLFRDVSLRASARHSQIYIVLDVFDLRIFVYSSFHDCYELYSLIVVVKEIFACLAALKPFYVVLSVGFDRC